MKLKKKKKAVIIAISITIAMGMMVIMVMLYQRKKNLSKEGKKKITFIARNSYQRIILSD